MVTRDRCGGGEQILTHGHQLNAAGRFQEGIFSSPYATEEENKAPEDKWPAKLPLKKGLLEIGMVAQACNPSLGR